MYLCRPNCIIGILGTLNKYKVELKNMLSDTCVYKYRLDSQFFAEIDSPEIQKGELDVTLNVKRTSGVYQLDFQTMGTVIVTCDRCLDEMEQPVESSDTLKVKLGGEFSEVGDIVIIPEEDGYINVAWFIYEFITLSIPIKHVHALGKCNKDMVHKLNKHLRTIGDDADAQFVDENDEVREMDPRWNELKKILDNN